MRHAPADFAELLSPRGRRVLEGRDPLCGALLDPPTRFVARTDLIDRKKAEGLRALLERAMPATLEEMSAIIPPQTITEQEHNYGELLPKTARVMTAYLEDATSASFRAAQEIGLLGMLYSESFARFAAQLSGRPLRKEWGAQVLCYRPGDYAGPHNDHHPEDPEARDGYLDVHLTLAGPAVAHQFLVYQQRGHFSEMVKVSTLGGITAYRLPFWHYTTPLVAKRGREAEARRWVLLGTFLYKPVTHAAAGGS